MWEGDGNIYRCGIPWKSEVREIFKFMDPGGRCEKEYHSWGRLFRRIVSEDKETAVDETDIEMMMDCGWDMDEEATPENCKRMKSFVEEMFRHQDKWRKEFLKRVSEMSRLELLFIAG